MLREGRVDGSVDGGRKWYSGLRRLSDFEVAICVVTSPVLFAFCNQVRAMVEHVGFL